MRITFVIMQFRVTISTKCQVLSHCMNVSYIVGHGRLSCFLLQYIVQQVLIMF
jgi:hypothetical protein